MKYEQEFMEEVLLDNLDNSYQDDIQQEVLNNYLCDYV